MRRGDDRGVTVQIGAILLLAILFSALVLYQINVVPAENEAIEYDHSQQVQNELQELRNAIQNVGTADGFRATSVTLGTQYPTRTFTVNPPDPQGTLGTTGRRPLTIENASLEGEYYRTGADGTSERVGTDDIVGTHNTTTFAYEPDYNEYRDAPTTRLEHSLAFNEFGERSVPLRGAKQQLVSNDSLTVALLEGDLSESTSGAVTVDAETLSGPSDPIDLAADGGNITVSIPTDHPARWNETLGRATANETGFDAGENGVRVVGYDHDADALTIEFREDSVTIRIARVGLDSRANADSTFDIERADDSDGRDGGPTNPYGVTWSDEAVTATPGETVSLTALVDDGIERPLADFAYTDPDGVIVDDSFIPDETTFRDGTASVEFDINRGATAGEATVFVSTGSGLAEATVTVESEENGGENGEGGGEPTITSASASHIVANSGDESQTFAFTLDSDLDAGETVTIDIDDPQDSGAGGGQSPIVDYPNADSGSGTITIAQGSGSAVLEQSGRKKAELRYTAEESGDASGSEVRVTVDDIETGDIAGNEYDAVFELESGARATATFGIAETEGDRTVSGTVDGNVYSTGSLTFSQGAVVHGNADADGPITLGYQSEVTGSLTSSADVTTGQESVVSSDIDARGDVSLGYDSAVDGSVSSGGSVTLEQASVVSGDIDAAGPVSLGYDSTVEGSITSDGPVTLEQRATVADDVTAERVELGYDSAIDGDVFVDSAGDIDCGGEATINGQPCQNYVDENY